MPRWYQKRFLQPGQSKFFYLDLKPDTVVCDGVAHVRDALLRWGPKKCFYRDDLYTLRFGRQTTDELEKSFFGTIDDRGCAAVDHFANFQGVADRATELHKPLVAYIGAQRFRTPRALDDIQKRYVLTSTDQNPALAAMRMEFQSYSALWSEGIWEIVRARESATKFIVSDHPVTFYCKHVFPSEWQYPNDVSLKQIGTRTIFPLGLDSCLIITHLQLVRNPWSTPTEFRANARFFGRTLVDVRNIQFGRELEEDEVLRINSILKRRATRYIAAAEEEWLYPESRASTTEWSQLDHDWFLLPHLWNVKFTTGIMTGSRDGPVFAMDEYGRRPWDRNYENREQREREWETFERAKHEWARTRLGKSTSRVDDGFGRDFGNEFMQRYLREQGLL